MTTASEFNILLPLASAWVEAQEQVVLRAGIPLSEPQIRDARTAGVIQPERVRVLLVPQVPLPEHPVLRAVCDTTKAITPRTIGLCVRYGIFVRSERWGERDLLVHELVHTSQFEKLGSIPAFLQQYLHECITIGYPQGPMEQEAVLRAAKICSSRDRGGES